MPITDTKSFIIGLQVGRRIKMWDTYKKIEPPVSDRYLVTEYYDEPILTEDGQHIMGE